MIISIRKEWGYTYHVKQNSIVKNELVKRVRRFFAVLEFILSIDCKKENCITRLKFLKQSIEQVKFYIELVLKLISFKTILV
jgi:hypothetical protein